MVLRVDGRLHRGRAEPINALVEMGCLTSTMSSSDHDSRARSCQSRTCSLRLLQVGRAALVTPIHPRTAGMQRNGWCRAIHLADPPRRRPWGRQQGGERDGDQGQCRPSYRPMRYGLRDGCHVGREPTARSIPGDLAGLCPRRRPHRAQLVRFLHLQPATGRQLPLGLAGQPHRRGATRCASQTFTSRTAPLVEQRTFDCVVAVGVPRQVTGTTPTAVFPCHAVSRDDAPAVLELA